MSGRAQVTEARRVVVKGGSSSLTTAAGGIDPVRVRALVEVLAGARARGIELVLVSIKTSNDFFSKPVNFGISFASKSVHLSTDLLFGVGVFHIHRVG